jgi:threonine/homoserine/homoserine lactone efflux protein
MLEHAFNQSMTGAYFFAAGTFASITGLGLIFGYIAYMIDPHFLAEHAIGLHATLDQPHAYITILLGALLCIGAGVLIYLGTKHLDQSKKILAQSSTVMTPFTHSRQTLASRAATFYSPSPSTTKSQRPHSP